MKLSIVIVNYNVKYFLKQCLASVFGSQRRLADGSELEIDVWVVDNDSVDGSVEMVGKDFPQVQVIANKENIGFARANNQALERIAERGQQPDSLILLLNPDTLVEPDTLVRCADFMQAHPDCGGLCVKMLDGEGNYLPESKRGFPTPEASFYKISGLIRLFPHSQRFAAYYMGHLDDNAVNEIEIMPGAFLMFRHEVYSAIGGLDESYFMYGEDIDFSWRIRMAGYKNYYLPETHIIHYKGESTKKGSMNYVYTFYNAMSIFVKKYYSGRDARLFNGLLQVAIWLRATLAWLGRIGKRLALPAMDFALAYGGFLLLKQTWATLWGGDAAYYPSEYTTLIIPLYILFLMAFSWLNGGYDRPTRLSRIARGMGIGLLILLAFYSLLNDNQRYSRMLLLTGSLWTMTSTILIRLALSAAGSKEHSLRKRGRTLIVGSAEESERVRTLYHSLGMPDDLLVSDSSLQPHRLQEIIRIEHIEEVVFCGADIELPSIIDLMSHLKTTGVEYRIAPAQGDFIIGTGGILSPDALYLDNLDTISTDTCRRRKRLFDIGTSVLLLVASPLLFWFQKRKSAYFPHCLQVLTGRLTWVGYTGRLGVFSPHDLLSETTADTQRRLLLRYMCHYKTTTDSAILLRNWNNI